MAGDCFSEEDEETSEDDFEEGMFLEDILFLSIKDAFSFRQPTSSNDKTMIRRNKTRAEQSVTDDLDRVFEGVSFRWQESKELQEDEELKISLVSSDVFMIIKETLCSIDEVIKSRSGVSLAVCG